MRAKSKAIPGVAVPFGVVLTPVVPVFVLSIPSMADSKSHLYKTKKCITMRSRKTMNDDGKLWKRKLMLYKILG